MQASNFFLKKVIFVDFFIKIYQKLPVFTQKLSFLVKN